MILKNNMSVLVTGSNGFIGKNLIVRLNELNIQVTTYTRENSTQDLIELIKDADCIVHLAGEIRPKEEKNFDIINAGLTKSICNAVRSLGKCIPVIFASSTQAMQDNAYGKTKLNAENILESLKFNIGCPIYMYRLPGVFGKWCKPEYNSVVATFCYNINRDLPIQVNNSDFELSLVYIDDVVKEFIKVIQGKMDKKDLYSVQPMYKIKLGVLADQIKSFKESRDSLITERVGEGLVSKLYSTYVSYMPPRNFSYPLDSHIDERGIFAEILKTKDSGQFSFFTSKPGATRGGHYHHSKTEKFLVIRGKARFGFTHLDKDESYEIIATSKSLKIVETVPGWSHDITNIGKEDMIVVLWANEIFDPSRPDTITHEVKG